MTMAQFDSDNLRIARPSEVLSNIKVMVSIQNFGQNCFLRSLLLVKDLVCTYMGIQLESGPKCRPRWLISIIFCACETQFFERADVLLSRDNQNFDKKTFVTFLELMSMLCFYFLLSQATMASLRGLENYSEFFTL